MLLRRIPLRRGSSQGERIWSKSRQCRPSLIVDAALSSHLPLLSIGMEQLQLSNSNLAEEYFLAAQAINSSDPLLLNELGVVAYNKEE